MEQNNTQTASDLETIEGTDGGVWKKVAVIGGGAVAAVAAGWGIKLLLKATPAAPVADAAGEAVEAGLKMILGR